eukprot:100195-Hanusia_phi.AAC.1
MVSNASEVKSSVFVQKKIAFLSSVYGSGMGSKLWHSLQHPLTKVFATVTQEGWTCFKCRRGEQKGFQSFGRHLF